jgi:hypothetical protein
LDYLAPEVGKRIKNEFLELSFVEYERKNKRKTKYNQKIRSSTTNNINGGIKKTSYDCYDLKRSVQTILSTVSEENDMKVKDLMATSKFLLKEFQHYISRLLKPLSLPPETNSQIKDQEDK